MSVKVKMKSSGKWNIMGEHKMLEEGGVYELPEKCAKEICDNDYGEYTKSKKKPAPEENKAIEPEENKAEEPEEEAKPDVEYTEDGEKVAKTYDDMSPEAEAERQELAATKAKEEQAKEKKKKAAKSKKKKSTK